MDVAVICPLAPTNMANVNPCEAYARKEKHGKYDAAFLKAGVDFDFCALVCETSGGINLEGEEFLKQLFRFGARRTGERLCVYAARAYLAIFNILLRR